MAALTKELDEMATDGRSDADVAALRRAKNDLEMKVKDQVSGFIFLWPCLFDSFS